MAHVHGPGCGHDHSGTQNLESFYEGSGEFLQTNYGSVPTATHGGGAALQGFSMNGHRLGFPGLPTTANQLGQAIEVIKSGVKAFEVTTLGLQGEDIVPLEHYDEMRALMKLSGVRPSLHGPLIDPAGFGDRGWGGEEGRKVHERRIWDAVEKAHRLDPDGNVPIVFHASNAIGGREYVKIKARDKDGNVKKDSKGNIQWEKRLQKSLAVNRETGQAVPIEYEEKYRPYMTKEQLKRGGTPFHVLDSVESINRTEWDNKMTELATLNKHAEEIMGNSAVYLDGKENLFIDPKNDTFKQITEGGIVRDVEVDEQTAKHVRQMKKADLFVKDIELNFQTAFHKAYKYGTDEQKEELHKLSKDYRERLGQISGGIIKDSRGKEVEVRSILEPQNKAEFFQDMTQELKKITSNGDAPELYQEIEDFAMDKAAKTFGNVAMKSYNDFGDNAPLLVIENLPEHMAFNDPKTFRQVIEKSREEYIDRLQESGKSKKEAQAIAKKQIGATWDVGHINTIKKRGFTDEDIIEATEHVTEDPTLVKHIHLTDNFGFTDSHMAPGQGNVPIGGILGKIAEKTGKLEEMSKIIESGAFISQFRSSPLNDTLKAVNSPIYGMKAGPTWGQVEGIMGGYNAGFGQTNPSGHHSLYGAGFTTLPTDLGGAVGQDFSRFSGRPMA